MAGMDEKFILTLVKGGQLTGWSGGKDIKPLGE
jgi:hypothetical protein